VGKGPSGIVLLDKPPGPTSFDMVRVVRRGYGTRKVGHTGTLDPFASGLLVICLGEGTKLVPYLQSGEKEYLATVRFGVETDTLDTEGEVVREASPDGLESSAVEDALEGFIGVVDQVPPAHSAIKVDGRRAYELARRGKAPELAARQVRVHSLELLGFDLPDARLRLVCGSGYYVRSLARDLGSALGLPAHLTALRRTRNAGFDVADAAGPDAHGPDQAPAPPIPLEAALPGLPELRLDRDDAIGVGHGRPPVDVPPGLGRGPIRLVDELGCLLALAATEGDGLRLLRVFPADPRRFDPAASD
jgi:tRNA pseudouridine55 synthase